MGIDSSLPKGIDGTMKRKQHGHKQRHVDQSISEIDRYLRHCFHCSLDGFTHRYVLYVLQLASGKRAEGSNVTEGDCDILTMFSMCVSFLLERKFFIDE